MTVMSLAALSFLAPWMAWGAFAASGLPLLAHLLSKTRYREVSFPAARLVQQAVAATSRIETPRHLILMLLRGLILLLLVFAFMRPQWTPDARLADDGRGIALILLVDASASMQRTDAGLTLYDRASRQAHGLIDGLDPSRDVVSVIRVDHAPSVILPEPTAQFSLLKDRLSRTKPGYTHANWGRALTLAQRLTHDERREVRLIILSDQQGEQPDVAADHIRIVGPTDNTAVRLVDVRPYPAIRGQPITAILEARHFGEKPTTLQLSTRLAGQAFKQTLALAPGEARRLHVALPPVQDEQALIEVTLDTPDAIAADNLTGGLVPIQNETRVLVIHDESNTSTTVAKRLALLLNPGEVAGVTLPAVALRSASDALAVLDSADPAELRTIVLFHQGPLPDPLSQKLEAYARSGGGVVQFLVDESASPSQRSRAFDIDFDLPPLRLFEGPARAGLAALPWPGVSNAMIDPQALPILVDAQARVIVAELLRGRGRLIAINAALGPEPGGLLAEPVFVVLFNELCRYASPGPALPLSARPGDPLPGRLRNAAHPRWAEGADPNALSFTAPGPYAVLDQSGLAQELIYVQLDPNESNTSRPPAWSHSSIGLAEGDRPMDDQAVADSLGQAPIELWPYVVLGMLGLVATESLLLYQFAGPRKPARQRGVQ